MSHHLSTNSHLTTRHTHRAGRSLCVDCILILFFPFLFLRSIFFLHRAIQPYIAKCFEGVDRLEFGPPPLPEKSYSKTFATSPVTAVSPQTVATSFQWDEMSETSVSPKERPSDQAFRGPLVSSESVIDGIGDEENEQQMGHVIYSMISGMEERLRFNKVVVPYDLNVKHPQKAQPPTKGALRDTFSRRGSASSLSSSIATATTMHGQTPAATAPEVKPELPVLPIEKWLLAVETEMYESMRTVIDQCLKEYNARETSSSKQTIRQGSTMEFLSSWFFRWPQQAVLAVNGVQWTKAVEGALRGQSGGRRLSISSVFTAADSPIAKSLRSLLRSYNGRLEWMSSLAASPLCSIDRFTLNSVITLTVHQRDVISELVEAGVESEEDFSWIMHLRYYTEVGKTDAVASERPEIQLERAEVRARMVTTELPYGYEYGGNSSRLVVTPLTLRAYRTLMIALKNQVGRRLLVFISLCLYDLCMTYTC